MTSGTEKRARTATLTIRLTPAERAKIDGDADRKTLTPGSYAREVLLGAATPRQVRRPPVEAKALARLLGELGKVGSNLNQLAKSANAGMLTYGDEILVSLADLKIIREAILNVLGRGQ